MKPTIKSSFLCAPLAEITTPAFRRVIRMFSKNTLLYSEMLSAGALAARSAHNEPLLMKTEFDDPIIYQIVGSDPDVMADACRVLAERECHSVDINMGCASPDIRKTRGGVRLMSNPSLAAEIVRKCRKIVTGTLSVKMRSGYEETDEEHLLKLIRMLEEEGIDFLTLHPRHGKLSFKRQADWNLLKKIKNNIRIPLIGNGDIDSPEMAIRKKNTTPCDGIMIGRGAVSSPWIFRLCNSMDRGITESLDVNIHELFILTLGYIKYYLPPCLHKSRGHRFCYYFSRNVKFSHNLFTKIRRTHTIEGMSEQIDEYFYRLPEESIKKIILKREQAL